MVMKRKQKVSVIIQARIGSTRLPGKVMMDLCGKTVLARVIESSRRAKTVDSICVAMPESRINDVVEAEAKANKADFCRGNEDDVLDRYCKAARKMKSDIIVRVTSDNPLTEPGFIDMCVEEMIKNDLEFVAVKNMPYGSNVEVVLGRALSKVSKMAKLPEDREHVTAYFYKNPGKFKMKLVEPAPELRRPDIRLTLDTLEDYYLLWRLFRNFKDVPSGKIDLEDAIAFIDSLKLNR